MPTERNAAFDPDCVQIEPLPPRDQFLLLRIEADRCRRLEYELERARESRDRIALALVDADYTWRDVAAVAGFKNPYIATLKRRRDGR